MADTKAKDPERSGELSDVEALNDHLARSYPIDDYYDRSILPIRMIESRRLAIIRAFVDEREGMRIAEVGSGGGHVLRMFRRSKLTAIDVSSVFLDTARKNLAGYDVTFIKGEIDKMEALPTGFDRVICTEVLEHTIDPPSVLAAIARMLAPGGKAVITVPNDPLIHRLKMVVRVTPMGWMLRKRINWGGDHLHLHQWTPSQFREVLSERFRVLDHQLAPSALLPIRACFLCVPRS
jgi:2-polyprenyl-3-methyl-5-hydroxy-6-metoxy-1,4-benzoquinol methylase